MGIQRIGVGTKKKLPNRLGTTLDLDVHNVVGKNGVLKEDCICKIKAYCNKENRLILCV